MTIDTMWLLVLMAALFAGILSGVPIMLVLLGVPLWIAGLAMVSGHFDADFFGAYVPRLFGLANNTLLIAVPLFVAMGLLLERSRTAERMLMAMAGLMGGSRQSLVLAVLIVSALIAASTGIIGATIVMLGLISLPAMVRAGVPLSLSSGLVCASGTLGQIIPPSIVLILLGDQIGNSYLEAQLAAGNFAPDPVSVADLFAGALLPGLLLVSLYGVYVLLHSVTWPAVEPRTTASRKSAASRSDTSGTLALWRVFLPPLLLIMSVLGSILAGVATPTEASAIGSAGALLLAAASLDPGRRVASLCSAGVVAAAILLLAGQGVGLPDGLAAVAAGLLVISLGTAAWSLRRDGVLLDVLQRTVLVTAMVFGIIAGASMLSLVFRGFGGDEVVESLLAHLPGGDHGALLAVMLVIFVLGFILEFVEIIFIVLPIVGPVLLATEFDPVWIAILLAMNLQTSFLTPPFGFALFYFRSVAPVGMTTLGIYRAVAPFVALQVLGICLLAAFPALATWLPELLD